jgi:hypothetical protein
MAARRGGSTESAKDGSARIYDKIWKTYLLWAVGIIIGVLGLKPTSANALGVTLTIEKPDVVQGIIYLVCILRTVDSVLNFQNTTNPFLRRDSLRALIWGSLPKGTRTFRGMSLDQLKEVRKKALNSAPGSYIVIGLIRNCARSLYRALQH